MNRFETYWAAPDVEVVILTVDQRVYQVSGTPSLQKDQSPLVEVRISGERGTYWRRLPYGKKRALVTHAVARMVVEGLRPCE